MFLTWQKAALQCFMTYPSKFMVSSKMAPMFRAPDVGSTVASPTVSEPNGGLGRCLAWGTRSSVLSSLTGDCLRASICSAHANKLQPYCPQTQRPPLWSSQLGYRSSAYKWNLTPWLREGSYRPNIGLSLTQTPGEDKRSVDDQKNSYLWFRRTMSDWTSRIQSMQV